MPTASSWLSVPFTLHALCMFVFIFKKDNRKPKTWRRTTLKGTEKLQAVIWTVAPLAELKYDPQIFAGYIMFQFKWWRNMLKKEGSGFHVSENYYDYWWWSSSWWWWWLLIMDTIGVQSASRSSAWLKVGKYVMIINHITENYSIEMFQHLVGGWRKYIINDHPSYIRELYHSNVPAPGWRFAISM